MARLTSGTFDSLLRRQLTTLPGRCEGLFRQPGGDFASPIKDDTFIGQDLPNPDYARQARELCDEHGALLIVDDVRAGLRLTRGCSWSLVGVKPDGSTWGQGDRQHHPISALRLPMERRRGRRPKAWHKVVAEAELAILRAEFKAATQGFRRAASQCSNASRIGPDRHAVTPSDARDHPGL